MKKLFLVITIALTLLSCKKKADDPPYLNISPTSLSFSSVPDDSALLVIESNADWQLSLPTGVGWVRLGKISGHGNDTVHVSVINNNGTEQRITTLTVKSNDGSLQAQVTVKQISNTVQLLMSKVLGGAGYDMFYAVSPATNGGCLLAGETGSNNTGEVGASHGGQDAWIVRLDTNGDTLWTRTLGGNRDDVIYSVTSTTDGAFVVAGYSSSNNSGDIGTSHGRADCWVVKMKDNGDIVWSKLIGTTADDIGITIASVTDGGFVVAGVSGAKKDDLFVVKLDNNGNTIWEKTYGGSDLDAPVAVSVSASGAIYVGGNSRSNNSGDLGANHGSDDCWVLKLTANGEKIWSKLYGGSGQDYNNAIKATDDDGCIFAGTTSSNNSGDIGLSHGGWDAWVVKLNANGNIVWQKMLGGSAGDNTNGVFVNADGSCVVAGGSASTDGDVGGALTNGGAWCIKLNSSGERLWSKVFNLAGYSYPTVLAMDKHTDGSYILSGVASKTSNAANGFDDGFVLRIKEN